MDVLKNLPYQIVLSIVSIIVIALILDEVLRRSLSRLEKTYGNLRIDHTQINFIKNSASFVIYAIAFFMVMYSIPAMKHVGASLLAGAGVMAAIVGFASQSAFSNIVSGIFILIFKPFRLGDTIQMKDGHKGEVTDITFRHTVIKDSENRRIIIPNNVVNSDTIINSTIDDEKVRKHIQFHVAYQSDLNLAMSIIRKEIENHPSCLDNRSPESRDKKDPLVEVVVMQWAENGLILRATVWAKSNDEAFDLQCDVLKSVKERFESEGIEYGGKK